MKNCLIFLSLLALAGTAGANDAVNEIWKDPNFQKQFLGTYGMNAEVEPRVTPEEVKVLEKLLPLMSTDLPKAEKLLESSLKPTSSAMLDFTLGSIHFQQDKMIEALDSYRKAVGKFPSFRRAWRNLGLIYTRNSKYEDAISAFTRMIELGGGDAYSYGLLGFAYSAKQDYLAADGAYRNALLLQPENTEWRLGLVRAVLRQQKSADAVALLDVLLEKYPEKSEFWLLQANAYLNLKQPFKAAENLECVDRLGKAKTDDLFTLGDIYLSETLPDLAARSYKRAVAADAQQKSDRALRSAELLAARGALAQSKLVLAQIQETFGAKLAEADRRKLLKLEARIALSQGGAGEAVGVLEEVVKLDPLDGEALMLLAQHYGKTSQPEKAVFYYERAGNIEKFEAEAKVRHAQLLVTQSKYQDALPLLRRAQELRPRDDLARYAEQIERLAKSRR